MYTYPEALNAMEMIISDLFRRAGWQHTDVKVVADSVTGTASVDWRGDGQTQWPRSYVTVNMPVRPAQYRMTATEFEHYAAYVIHEVGHPLWTSKSVWLRAVATGRHTLLNALEDVRIEKATIDANLALNTRRALGALCDSLNTKALSEGYDPNDLKSLGWTLSFLGRGANGYEMDVASVRNRIDPQGEVASVLGWALSDLAACRSTQACLDLVDKIIAALNAGRKSNPGKPRSNPGKGQPQPPQGEPQEGSEGEPEAQEGKGRAGAQSGSGEPQEGSEGEGQGKGENGTAQGSGEPQEGSEGEGQGKGEGEPQEGSEAQEEGENGSQSGGNGKGSQGSGSGQKSGEPEEVTGATFEEVDLAPNHNEVMTSDQRGFHTQQSLVDVLRRGTVLPRKVPQITGKDWNDTRRMVEENAARMGKQRALLARALRKAELDDYEGGRVSGRLDRRAGAKLIAGSPAVFGRRLLTEGYDTDVEILIDGSSSMSGASARAAATLALVVAQAAAQVGVDCFTHVFSDWGLRAVTEGKRKPESKLFGYAASAPRGGTPLTENMIRAAHMQAARAQGKRRIMFVVTDGACDMGTHIVKAAGEYLEACMGVEIANLHIGSFDLKAFRNTVVVRPWDVATAGLKSMTDLLEKGA
jgi:hypothetical protein